MPSTVDVAHTGRRERKKQATRQAIHEAARDLVDERGLGAVTVDAIAERADVATRTFFNHFRNKEEAVLGSDPSLATDTAEDLRSLLAGGTDPVDALRAALTAQLHALEVSSEGLRQRMQLLHREPSLLLESWSRWDHMTATLIDVVADATGADPGSLRPAVLVQSAVATARAALLHWGEHPTDSLDATVAAAFADLRAWLCGGGVPGAGRPFPTISSEDAQ